MTTEFMGMDTRVLYTLLIGLVIAERLVELVISNRNTRELKSRGALEVGAGHYPVMVVMHTLFLVCAPLEVWLLSRPFIPPLALAMIFVLIAAMSLRYWVISTLQGRWTTRIICLPGAPLVATGPYRYLRHPNYLAVVAETFALPMVHTAWMTAIVFTILQRASVAGAHSSRRPGPVALRRLLRRGGDGGRSGGYGVTRQEILETIQELARTHLDHTEPVTLDQDLIEDLRLDSLKLLTLAVQVENHFQICIDSDTEAAIRTIGDLVSVIERQLSEKRPDNPTHA